MKPDRSAFAWAAAAVLLCSCAHAGHGRRWHELSQAAIAKDLKAVHKAHKDLQGRVEAVSERFLGTTYELGPLGEGDAGEFDRDPMISFKKADCTTYVEEVMALSLEGELDAALKTLQRIRYRDGSATYEDRNHFPETDWLPNNIKAGYLEDITRSVAGEKTKELHKLISKSSWYHQMSTASLKGFDSESPAEREERAKRLRAVGDRYQDEVSTIPYVAAEDLDALAALVPSGAVGSLVREDRPDKPVVVTHQVLFIQKGGKLYIRHAASGRAVEDAPAVPYFEAARKYSWPVLGVNLARIRAP